jgi:hypothetical protein
MACLRPFREWIGFERMMTIEKAINMSIFFKRMALSI